MNELLKNIDAKICKIEKFIIFIALMLMTSLVFLDVVQRTFSRPIGKTAQILMYFFKFSEEKIILLSDISFALISLCLVIYAVFIRQQHKTKHHPKKSKKQNIFIGTIAWIILAASIKLLIYLFPSGIPGAQKFALGLMVWSGFLGASLATYNNRHVIVGGLSKIYSENVLGKFSLIGGLLSAIFCFILFALGLLQTRYEILDWLQAPGIGVFEALPIPLWVVTVALPISFLLIGLRFLLYGFIGNKHNNEQEASS